MNVIEGWAREVIQSVKALRASKPDDLSSISRTHMVYEVRTNPQISTGTW